MSPAPLRLVFDVRGELLEAARQCEAEVFLARFGNTAQQLDDAYGKYEPDTHFQAVLDRTGRVVAASRLVFPGPNGLPTMDGVAAPPWNFDPIQAAEATAAAGLDLDRTMDISTFAVRDGLHKLSFGASYGIMYGLFAAMAANQVASVLAIIDAVPIQLLRDVGVIFHPIPGSTGRPFFGSPDSTPMYGHLDEVLATQQRLAPRAYQALGHGIGLNVEVPPVAGFRLP